jgi:hypothetical protein
VGIVAVPIPFLVGNILRWVVGIEVLVLVRSGFRGIGFLMEIKSLLFPGLGFWWLSRLRLGGFVLIPRMSIISETEVALGVMVCPEGVIIRVVMAFVRVMTIVMLIMILVMMVWIVIVVIRIMLRIIPVVVSVVLLILISDSLFFLTSADFQHPLHPLALFLSFQTSGLALEQEGEPDTDLVKNDHRPSQKAEREGVRGGGDQSRDDKDREDGIGPGAPHHLTIEDPQLNEGHHENGKLKA